VHSSTFNSRGRPVAPLEQDCSTGAEPEPGNRRVRRAIITLLAALALVIAAAECSARILFPRISHIQQRIVHDQMTVKATAMSGQGDGTTVLLVGNSLLLQGLDYPRLIADSPPNIRPVRYVIENTSYLDWYYGLHRLFSEGVRPSVVILCLNLGQTIDHGILGDYSARHLFLAADLIPAARDAGLDNTRTSGLFFAHWSAFYADRATIRNYILNISDPAYAEVMNRLARVPPSFPPDDEMLEESRVRLRSIMKLCRDYHADFVLLVPPSLKLQDQLLAKAGKLENIPVDIPVPLGSLGPEFFGDGFHLNQKGAELFTDALAQDLRSRLRP
jgi:hypothetical protein